MADFSINGEAKLDTSGLQGSLSTITSAAGNVLSGLTKAAAGAMAAGATASAALAKQALSSYATYEQAIGGVETLYKTSADTVIRYAENAYKTAGMSANDYMNTVTSFAASLVSSLGGDTAQAAELANMAITDMADNANKMGTAMQSIQDAYQGFAKQNYTMLDNLKLGYGGTQAEMQRLLQDAQALSGIHFELGNYADMVQAIHIIQTEMGIAGTTALEAATTIEGSVASLKAAWSNLLTGMADDSANVAALVDTLAETFATAAGNILPRLVQIFEGMGDAVTAAAPAIAAQIPPMVESLLPSFLTAATALVTSIAAQLPSILGAVVASVTQVMADTGAQAAYQLIAGFAANLPGLIAEGMSALVALADYLIAHMDVVFDVGLQLLGGIIEGIRDGLPDLLYAAAQLVTSFGVAILDHSDELVELGVEIVYAIIEGIANAVADFGEAALGLIARFLHIWDGNMDSFGQIGTNAVKSITDGILSGESDVQNAAKRIYEAAMRGFSGMGGGQSSGGGTGRGGGAKRSLAAHDQSYWEQVAQHFQTTGQDQKNGDYRTAAEKAAASTYAFSTALDTLTASGGKAAQQTETLADKTEKAMADLGDSFVYTGSAAQEQASRLAVLEAAYDTARTNVGKYKQLLDDSIDSSGAASEMSQYLAQQLEQEENAVESAKKALDAYRDSLDTAKQAAQQLEAAQEQLADTWNSSYLKKLQSLAANLLDGNLEDALLDAGEIAWQKLDTATQQQLVDLAQSWADTLETAFAQDGFAGLAAADKTIAESLAAGLQDTSSVTGALIDNVLGQVGISGGVEGLLNTIAELAPLVLGVAAAAAAVSAGVAGVASAFAYTVEQSQALQAKVQELTADGQALTAELSAALDVLQPFLEQSSAMLEQLDQVTALISDTFAGIGIEIMETMVPIIQQILGTLLPVLVALQPALEAVGDLLRTLLGLFGSLVTSALTALQPILMAIGPLLETLALLLNTIASIVSALLSPALQVLGEVLNWLLQPVLWVAQAINAAVRLVVSLINSLLRFLGFKVIDLPDGSASRKGQAANTIASAVPTRADTQTDFSADRPDYTANTDALNENTEALKEQTELIRNPPRYQTGGGGPATGVIDYSAMLAAARAAVLAQNTKAVTNYDAGSGQTTARLNASWHGESTTVLELDGKEIARATAPYMDEELAF